MGEIMDQGVSRRGFLKAGAVGPASAAAVLATPSVLRAQSPIVVKMQTSWPSTDFGMDAAKAYADCIRAMSGGRLAIELTPAGAIVGAFQVLDAVHDGVLDAAHTVPAYWYGKHKGASLFGTGPVFGGSATVMLAWIHQGGGMELYRELTQDILGLNTYGFFAFPMPAQPLGWFKEPVTAVADIKGLKYRTVGLAADLMQKMGMNVVQLPGGEIASAMERGVIDAFEFNNPSSDMSFGAQDTAKNYFLSSYHQASELYEIIFNKDFFDGLEEDLQAILRYGVDAVSTINTAMALNTYSMSLQKLKDEHGVRLHRTSKALLDAQLRAWDALIPELERDDFIRRCMDSQRAWVERVVFYELMNAPDYAFAYDHYFPGKLKL